MDSLERQTWSKRSKLQSADGFTDRLGTTGATTVIWKGTRTTTVNATSSPRQLEGFAGGVRSNYNQLMSYP